MPIRWEMGPWWGEASGEPQPVSITNAGTQTIFLGAAVASTPRYLTVKELTLSAPVSDPLKLLLMKTGADHPLSVLGACSIRTNTTIRVDDSALDVAGTFRVSGSLDLARGRVAAKSELLVGESVGAPALVTVTGGMLTVTNADHNARLIIGLGGRGDFCLNGGTVEADFIQVTNTGNRFIFNSGKAKVGSLMVTNFQPITVGDGVHAATLVLSDGTNVISRLLTVTNNATLTVEGTATINGPVANYGTILAGRPGDQLIFASTTGYPSIVTNWGHMYMTNGGTLTFQGTVCNNVPAHITAMTQTGANFTFQFDSIGGLTHMLEYKNALSDPNWTSSLVSTNGTGETRSLTIPAPTGAARFYHIRVGP